MLAYVILIFLKQFGLVSGAVHDVISIHPVLKGMNDKERSNVDRITSFPLTPHGGPVMTNPSTIEAA